MQLEFTKNSKSVYFDEGIFRNKSVSHLREFIIDGIQNKSFRKIGSLIKQADKEYPDEREVKMMLDTKIESR